MNSISSTLSDLLNRFTKPGTAKTKTSKSENISKKKNSDIYNAINQHYHSVNNKIHNIAYKPIHYFDEILKNNYRQTYFFFRAFYNNQRLPHLAALIIFSMITGWMALPYSRLFKLHTEIMQDGIHLSEFSQISLAVLIWGVLRVVSEKLTVTLCSYFASDVSKQSCDNVHKKLTTYNNQKSNAKEVACTDFSKGIEDFFENFAKSIVFKSMNIVKIFSWMYYIVTNAGNKLLNLWMLPLPISYLVFRTIMNQITPNQETLNSDNKMLNEHQRLLNDWIPAWASGSYNGRLATRNNNNRILSKISDKHNALKKNSIRNIALLETVEKISKKIGDILSFICLIQIYGLPKLQTTSSAAGIFIGYGALKQIQENIIRSIDTTIDIFCGNSKVNQKQSKNYASINNLENNLQIQLSDQATNTKVPGGISVINSLLLSSSINCVISAWTLICHYHYNHSIANIMTVTISPSLATANLVVTAAFCFLGILASYYYQLPAKSFQQQIPLNFIAHTISLPLVNYALSIITITHPISIWAQAITSTLSCFTLNSLITTRIAKLFYKPLETSINRKYTSKPKENKNNSHEKPYRKFDGKLKLKRGDLTAITGVNSVGKSVYCKGIVDMFEASYQPTSKNTIHHISDMSKHSLIIEPGNDGADIRFYTTVDSKSSCNLGVNRYENFSANLKLDPDNCLYFEQGKAVDAPFVIHTNQDSQTTIIDRSRSPNTIVLEPMKSLFLHHILSSHDSCTNYIDLDTLDNSRRKLVEEIMDTKYDDSFSNQVTNYLNFLNSEISATDVQPSQSYSEVKTTPIMAKWYAYINFIFANNRTDLKAVDNFSISTTDKHSGGFYSKIITALQTAYLHVEWIQLIILDEPLQQMDMCSKSQAKSLLQMVNKHEKKFVITITHDISDEKLIIKHKKNGDIIEITKAKLNAIYHLAAETKFTIDHDVNQDMNVLVIEKQTDADKAALKWILNDYQLSSDNSSSPGSPPGSPYSVRKVQSSNLLIQSHSVDNIANLIMQVNGTVSVAQRDNTHTVEVEPTAIASSPTHNEEISGPDSYTNNLDFLVQTNTNG